MDKKHLNDEELIKMLQNMPTIRDERPREIIYSRLQDAIEPNSRIKKRKNKSFPFWPVVATAAAFFLVFILTSSLLGQDDKLISMDSGKQEMAIENERRENGELVQEDPELFEAVPDDTGDVGINNIEEGNQKDVLDEELYQNLSAIYPEQIGENHQIFTFAMPDLLAQSAIPVSFIVPKDAEKTWVDQYNDLMSQLQGNKLGLSDYYPYQGALSLDPSGNLTLNLDAGSSSMWGSAGEHLFFESLDAFRFLDIDQIYLLEDGEPGIQTQIYSEPLEIYAIPEHKKTGYMLYQTNEDIYLAPTPENYENIESAFDLMRADISTHELQASIPESMSFEIQMVDSELKIQFQDGTQLEDNAATLLTLEAILLTAKEFGYTTVTFENAGINQIGIFNLNQTLAVPLAPNHIKLN